ncbi:NAD(P)-dependent alcohol dehydrogenase [Glycomyces sp. L485]|uniref:NAD(P)-dependent alcohol dehydrogenase n=1 Tax=Glycomyces sp. L485 TaxID=2909235 RepID=UPI001F4B20EE|nr:NAD(P)-dependent alcohol dehydrogenase [Glycomyces sp. L485]MCH7229356.1 NAD(P)-dependent alcohol dehydrogenase [Glycomyces sp. L485]
MKAVVCERYGPPEGLALREVDKPEPAAGDVLVKVLATTAHVGDTRIRRADPFLARLVYGLFAPKKNLVLGLELSGVVEAVGQNVTSFTAGDEVFAFTGFGLGGYAEYRCLPAVDNGRVQRTGLVAPKPANLTHEEAAAVPAGGLTALKNLQKARVGQGHKILINGASGSLGTYAVQLAKHHGAEVTAVCGTGNRDLVVSLGADEVIDYTEEDFTRTANRYDIVYDAVMKTSAARCRRILKQGGVFVNNSRLPKIEYADLLHLKDLIERGHLRPVIDRTYPMEEIVEAHRYVDKGHKRGNVSITVSSTPPPAA